MLQDLEDRDIDHVNALEERDTEWRGEVEDARFREEEAKGVSMLRSCRGGMWSSSYFGDASCWRKDKLILRSWRRKSGN